MDVSWTHYAKWDKSERQKQIPHDLTYMWNIKKTKLNWWRRQWRPTPGLLPGKSHGQRSLVGCSPWGCKESDMTEWLHFHTLEKEMATHSSVLAWRIPGTGEPGGPPSMGSHRVGHDWSDLAAAAAAYVWLCPFTINLKLYIAFSFLFWYVFINSCCCC